MSLMLFRCKSSQRASGLIPSFAKCNRHRSEQVVGSTNATVLL